MFLDRNQAGRELAARLQAYAGRPDVTVLGLPRGGVVVAYEVAQALNAPLDVLIVRKLGVPGRDELAMGAIASGGIRVLNPDVINGLDIPMHRVEAVAAREETELRRREKLYRGDREPLDARGRNVILVDDGLATGATMQAAVKAIRQQEPARIAIAVPVAAQSTCDEFRGLVEEMVCLETPEPFVSVGSWYENFDQTSDEEVRELLHINAPA